MPSSKNVSQLEALKSKLESAKAIVLADYLGLTVAQMGQLRDKVRAASGELQVAKNTLLKLALNQPDLNESLHGPTILLTATKDEIGPLKALVEFSQDTELPQVKAGLVEGKILKRDQLLELAKLPGRTELYAQLVGSLNSSLFRLVTVLSSPQRQLVYVLQAIKSKGGDN